MDNGGHFLLLDDVVTFDVIELPTLKCNGLAFLYEDSINGEVRGFRLYLKRFCVVRKNEDKFLDDNLFQISECTLAFFGPMQCLVLF